MTTGILFCVTMMMLMCINDVDSQRTSEIQCSKYSRVSINPLNPNPHRAIWSLQSESGNLWQYVILISDKFLIGNKFRNANRKTFINPTQNGIVYFNSNDVHTVRKIIESPSFGAEYLRVVQKVFLLQIDRITLDSNHRAACLWSRNIILPDTVQFWGKHENQVFTLTHLEAELITKNLTYDAESCVLSNLIDDKSSCILLWIQMDNDTEYNNWGVHPTMLQVYTPYHYLPTNYFIFGFGQLTFSRRQAVTPISIVIDWIEAYVWETIDTKSCGMAQTNINPVILNSQPTAREEFPWHAALFYILDLGKREYKCGGTLLNEITVVTAAHCVSAPTGTLSHKKLLIILGKHDLNLASLDSRETEVIKVVVHKFYDTANFENDIALLKLHTVMRYTKYIQPICITNNPLLFENNVGVLPGWGLNELNKGVEVLAKASFPIRSKSECRGRGNIITALSSYLNENNFCAGYDNATNVCSGDSGGGLVFDINNQWFLRGIASVGVALSATGMCDPLGLSIFTDVIKFYDWILDEI